MLFELIKAPTTFQGYINKIFAKKLNIFIIVYLNDIFIYIKDKRKNHVQVMCWVFNQLKKFSLYTNLKKYQFYQEKI